MISLGPYLAKKETAVYGTKYCEPAISHFRKNMAEVYPCLNQLNH